MSSWAIGRGAAVIADTDYIRRLAAIVVADVVDYSRLMGMDEEATHGRLASHKRDVLEPAISRHRGRLVKTSGDGFLIEFASVVDAVKFALATQTALDAREADLPRDRRIQLRFGVNMGDVIVDGEDLFGEGVNVAARLESLAEPGSIYITQEVRDQVCDKLPVAFEDMGRIRVKNISRPLHVFKVLPEINGATERPAGAPPSTEAFDVAGLEFDQRPAIAVLPFQNLSGDLDQEYFSDALTDDIVGGLSCWRWFPVIASSSTRVYKGRVASLSRIGLELEASYVLQGSVRKAGPRVLISCQLMEVASAQTLWAGQYERTLEDLLQVQQEIARDIVGAIEPELDHAAFRRAARKPAERMDSWDLVRRGNAHLAKYSRADAAMALKCYERALQLDPESVDALVQLGAWHVQRFWTQRGDLEWLEPVRDYARRAMNLDPREARAHALVGVYHMNRAEFTQSQAAYQNALRLNPSLAIAHAHLGSLRYLTGRREEALGPIGAALRLSPYDPHRFLWLGETAFVHYLGGDWEQALDYAARSMELRPGYFWVHLIWIASLARMGRSDEAAASLRSFRERFPTFSPDHVHWLQLIPQAQRDYLLQGVDMAD